jgi:Ras-related protein Rab-11A
MFDLTDEESFASLPQWYSLINDLLPESTPVFVVGNKIDLDDAIIVEDDAAQTFADKHRAVFLKVSALTGAGVAHLFTEVARRLATAVERDNFVFWTQETPPKTECC